MSDGYDLPVLTAFIAVTAQCAAWPVALGRPVVATALHFAAAAALSLSIVPEHGPTWPLTIPGAIALVVHVAVLAARHDWRFAVAVWWASILLAVLLVVGDPRESSFDNAQTTVIGYGLVSALVLAATIVWRQRGDVRHELAVARLDIRLEQDRRAVVEERTRIARELHDVVAHSMSIIHMQASSAPYRLPHLDDPTREEFTEIAATARSATREMRHLLGVLRDESTAAARQPVPGLDRLRELVDGVERAGVRTRLHVDHRVHESDVAETVAVTVYRITQEALSNVVRHAAGANAEVTLTVVADHLQLQVRNDQPPGGSDSSTNHTEELEGGRRRPGHGLVGMRERAQLLQGSVEHHRSAGGGYLVTALLPLRSPVGNHPDEHPPGDGHPSATDAPVRKDPHA